MSRVDLTVPDIGNFEDILVVDVLVKQGDSIEVDAPLVTLETDKASMDVPATSAGTVTEVLLKAGDKVSKGTVIARVETNSGADAPVAPGAGTGGAAKAAASQDSDGEFSAAFDADELERTVTQPVLTLSAAQAAAAAAVAGNTGTHATPTAGKGKGAAGAGGAATGGTTAGAGGASGAGGAGAASGGASAASNGGASARPEAPGDTVRMPIPDLSRYDRAEVEFNRSTQLLVLGSGPGGYTAAFRAADLGMKVTLVERWPSLGGVCLNVGCIPSKTLLHAAKVIEDAEAMGAHGIAFGAPAIDMEKLREFKGSVVKKLTGGLRVLAKQRKVDIVQGVGRFVGPNVIEVMGSSGSERIHFDYCIIAAGSEAVKLPGLPTDQRVMDSTDALELPEFSGGLLVVGGGIIGLEMACVYDALGSRVSVVELTPGLMPGTDPDLVRPLEKRIKARYEAIITGTKVTRVEPLLEGLRVTFEGEKAPEPQIYDRILVAVGRVPNGKNVGAENAGVTVSERGFIPVDKQMRTNVPHIFAIGDIAGPPMLAHKAMHEAKVAAEVAAGQKSSFDARVIPSVAYTDPEIAWVGLTEIEAKAKNIPFKKGSFPWLANGRSLSLGREEGFTKLLFDPETHRVLGGGIVGTNAGDLISEIALAIETGCDAADVGLTIHPHPTLSETVAGAADAFEGTLTDLYIPKR
ncbi:MAG: dihydrolipoamide dehydrogenase [Gammaproteobacteria bacterium]|nr:dihydrolipoamide dehydrogenase [Gammaproteobacteria bacterium]